MKNKFTCTNPLSSGEGVMTLSSDSAYTMHMKVSSASQGAPKRMMVDASGKWLGADCGAIKPAALPKQ